MRKCALFVSAIGTELDSWNIDPNGAARRSQRFARRPFGARCCFRSAGACLSAFGLFGHDAGADLACNDVGHSRARRRAKGGKSGKESKAGKKTA